MQRCILHVDMNNFFASVECMLNPELRDKPVAVCGSAEERHGIVLAKNYKAKACGVTTGEVVWQAKQKCSGLLVVPPHYEEYLKYSKLAKRIYERYTDQIESFGIDECWLDVTGSERIFGPGDRIANEIRESVKYELGLTVSCGVSFNKIFAKLGSDMKKPDAVTVIPKESFREVIWSLPAAELLGVGRSTQKVLQMFNIRTIGDLANASPEMLAYPLKSRAYQLHAFANGEDYSLVQHKDFEVPAKSVGHGITTLQDLEDDAEVWRVMLELAQSIGRKLMIYRKKATGIAIFIRNNELYTKQWQSKLPLPSQSASYLTKEAFRLFQRSYNWEHPIRSVTISAINLIPQDAPTQLELFVDNAREEKLARLDAAVFHIRERFGKDAIRNAVLCQNIKMDRNRTELTMPSGLSRMGGL